MFFCRLQAVCQSWAATSALLHRLVPCLQLPRLQQGRSMFQPVLLQC